MLEGYRTPHRLSKYFLTDALGQADMKILLDIKAPFVSNLLISFVYSTSEIPADTGGVQWMCAGKGIIHAEMPVHENGAPEPRGLQLWVDLPKQVNLM